jgi:hypothetical protein
MVEVNDGDCIVSVLVGGFGVGELLEITGFGLDARLIKECVVFDISVFVF